MKDRGTAATETISDGFPLHLADGFLETVKRRIGDDLDIGEMSGQKRRKTEEDVCHDGELSENVDFVENGADEASTSAVATVSLEGKGKTNVVRGLKVTKQRAVQFLSYEQLVFLALKNANFSSLTIGQVYGFIESTFSCFHSNDTYWKANVERAVMRGKITGKFDTTLTPGSMYVRVKTVSVRKHAIGKIEREIKEWMSQFREENIGDSRFSSLEEMRLVYEGAMGFVPPPAETMGFSAGANEQGKLTTAEEKREGLQVDNYLEPPQGIRKTKWTPREFPCRYCCLENKGLRLHLRRVHGFSDTRIDEFKAKLKRKERMGTRYMGVHCPKCKVYITLKHIRDHMYGVHLMTVDEVDEWDERQKEAARLGRELDSEEKDFPDEGEVPEGENSKVLGGGWSQYFHAATSSLEVPSEEWREVVVKEEPVEIPEISSSSSIEPPSWQPSPSPSFDSNYQAPVSPPGAINALDLLQDNDFYDDSAENVMKQEVIEEEMDIKPDKGLLDAEMNLGIIPKSKTFTLPLNGSRVPPPGHCMVCLKRVGQKSISRHLRHQHGFSDEDVLQYILADKRSLSCHRCQRSFKSQLSLTHHNRFCTATGDQPMQLTQPEKTKPVIDILTLLSSL